MQKTNEQTRTRPTTDKLRLAIAGVAAAAFTTLALAGCNTVKGAGQDLQESSDNVRDALSDND
ncbi:MAG: entericidin [Planctomycetota bacterium]